MELASRRERGRSQRRFVDVEGWHAEVTEDARDRMRWRLMICCGHLEK